MRIALFTDTFRPTVDGVARAPGELVAHASARGHGGPRSHLDPREEMARAPSGMLGPGRGPGSSGATGNASCPA